MVKIILLLLLLPFVIGISTMISQLISTILIILSVGLGGLVHRMFAGKPKLSWIAPEYLNLIQMIIITGFVYATIINIWGNLLNWSWLITLGLGLNRIFGVLIIVDMLTLVVLATIHGSFNVLGD